MHDCAPPCRGSHAGVAPRRREPLARGPADVHTVLDVRMTEEGSPRSRPSDRVQLAMREHGGPVAMAVAPLQGAVPDEDGERGGLLGAGAGGAPEPDDRERERGHSAEKKLGLLNAAEMGQDSVDAATKGDTVLLEGWVDKLDASGSMRKLLRLTPGHLLLLDSANELPDRARSQHEQAAIVFCDGVEVSHGFADCGGRHAHCGTAPGDTALFLYDIVCQCTHKNTR